MVFILYVEGEPCPLDLWEVEATFYWYGQAAPWWNRDGKTAYRDEPLPPGAIPFRVDDYPDGNHYSVTTAGDQDAEGYVIALGQLDQARGAEYVAAVLRELTAWSTGDVWTVEVYERVTWTADRETFAGGPPATRDTWEASEDYDGPTTCYWIENARQVMHEEYGA